MHLQPYSGCWQNSLTCGARTEVSLPCCVSWGSSLAPRGLSLDLADGALNLRTSRGTWIPSHAATFRLPSLRLLCLAFSFCTLIFLLINIQWNFPEAT